MLSFELPGHRKAMLTTNSPDLRRPITTNKPLKTSIHFPLLREFVSPRNPSVTSARHYQRKALVVQQTLQSPLSPLKKNEVDNGFLELQKMMERKWSSLRRERHDLLPLWIKKLSFSGP